MSVADNNFISLIPDVPNDWLDVEKSQEGLLLMNDRFIKDIEEIRQKYNIKVRAQGDYSEYAYMEYFNNPPVLASNKDFRNDVNKIVRKIKLHGDWQKILTDYIFGIDNIRNGNFEYEKSAMGRIAEADGKKYVEIHLYGDLTTPELRKIVSSKNVRELIRMTQPITKPYKTNDSVGFRVHQLRSSGMTYEAIWSVLKAENHKYEDWQYIQKIHSRFLAKVDKLYA